MTNIWNASAPPKQLDVRALFPLLPSILVWLFNQTMNGTAPLYSTLQPNKKCNDSVLIDKHKMEWLHYRKRERSCFILIDSSIKRTLNELMYVLVVSVEVNRLSNYGQS
jgi:hypothetical protein